ncbi:phage holin family protein [Altererythrobacter aquiaggeris]|uniref:phage holin family protein n=1 Tax=Aestuarierythrobacter aquiaggeris TaxID=1898396 RepID=UPI003015A84A
MAEHSLADIDADDHPDNEPQLRGSLLDDVAATIDDGKTYIEAELAYQKSRAAFAANKSKSAIGFALAGFAMLHIALIALVVGLVFALSPLITPLGATAVVFGGLVILGALSIRLAVGKARTIKHAFRSEEA